MVIALDKHRKPLGFITERRCRILCEKKRAVLLRRFPCVAIIRDVDARTITDKPRYRIKIDPGSITDGISIIDEAGGRIMFAMHIVHRASNVVSGLKTRAAARRNRRSRETRYRRCKWKNGGTFAQKGNEGRIPPSVRSIIGNTETWVRKLSEWVNLTDVSFEAVRFDTQLLDNPDIEGAEYQHGTLRGTEVRTYLMEKYQHTCQYCGGGSGDKVLEWEHIIPKSRHGSSRLRNATLSCSCCNREKGNRTPEEWLEAIQAKKHPTKLDKARIRGIRNVLDGRITGKSNRYCAWVNIARKTIERFLFAAFGDVECASGGRTKYNRAKLGFLKDHQYDAACVGAVPDEGYEDLTHGYYVQAQAMGRGTRFRGKCNACGIITKKLAPRAKRVFGCMNGDIVCADVPHRESRPYRYEGRFVGRVMTRASGSFDIRTTEDSLVTVSHRFVRVLQHGDGYQYRQCRTTEKNCQGASGRFPPGH